MKLALAWLIVGVPAGWGVRQTFEQSLKLFRAPANSAAPAATNQSAVAGVPRLPPSKS